MKRPVVIVSLIVCAGVFGAAWFGVRAWRARSPAAAASAATSAPPAGAASAPLVDATARGDVVIDARHQQLIGVRLVAVRRGSLNHVVRTVGTVRYDETRLSDINVRIEGWIRDLYADFTGEALVKGQRLFSLYSPDLRATSSEYVLALKARDALRESAIPEARQRADELVAASRTRLALWDVPDAALKSLEETRTVPDVVDFTSAVAGFIVEKTAVAGLHVMPGQSLYRVADLSDVWVEADLYDTDLAAVRVGQPARVTFDAFPGKDFAGRVVYVDPYVNDTTRTTRVRVALPNPAGRLRPGMFANVSVTMPAAVGLIVPADAVLDSGTEQIVFVAEGDGHFRPRTVKVGQRSATEVQIVDGLNADDRVASGAAFFLDSESQLRAALPAYAAPATPSVSGGKPAAAVSIALTTTPDPPTTGENQFEVSVKDATGAPISDADVRVRLLMPAMPTMNMPAMQNDVPLSPAGGGVYRGTGQVMMAGHWDATVSVMRGGQRLGAAERPLVAH